MTIEYRNKENQGYQAYNSLSDKAVYNAGHIIYDVCCAGEEYVDYQEGNHKGHTQANEAFQGRCNITKCVIDIHNQYLTVLLLLL